MPTGDKFSALPAASALTGAEITAVVQGGVTKQATVQDVADFTSLAAAPVWGRVYPASPATATHTGNTTQTTVATITIPSGTVRANSMIEIFHGAYSNSATDNDTLAIFFDGADIGGATITFNGGPINYPVAHEYVFAKSLAIFVNQLADEVAIDFTADVDVEFKVTNGNATNVSGVWAYGVRVTGGA
jgi:hypothetical protein